MSGQATFQQVRDEIDRGRPVGARIRWNNGGGHFVVIYGYSRIAGTEYFDIDDSFYGKSHLSVTVFPIAIREQECGPTPTSRKGS
jgi:hypothetical protein